MTPRRDLRSVVKLLTVTVALGLAAGCATTPDGPTMAELQGDTPVAARFNDDTRQYLLGLDEGDDPFVKVSFRTLVAITTEKQAAIDATGVRVDSVVGDVHTGVGAARDVMKLGALEFVEGIDITPPESAP